MRILGFAAGIALASTGIATAQTYATADQPAGVSSTTATSERVERTYSVNPLPAAALQTQPVQSVPTYEAYEPTAFDNTAYQTATEPYPALPVNPATPIAVESYSPTVDANFSQQLGTPETFAPIEDSAPSGELGFQSESETSRLLLALEDTYAKRVAGLKVKHLAQRKALLDQFEKDAADPKKVIGLAARMRTALAELEVAQKAMLGVEEKQFTAATLKVLDAAPSRVE